MKNKILSITGTRADYGLMRQVYKAIVDNPSLDLGLIVTGMHVLPEFQTSLKEIQEDNFCKIFYADMPLQGDSGKSMVKALGLAIVSMSDILEAERPDIMLLQGDRGEMLVGAVASAHMNIPIVHMSGGDYSGSIDDSIRNAISKFSHIHLTTCSLSSKRLQAIGEPLNRIFEVGEPGIDLIKSMEFIPGNELSHELQLDLSKPVIVATQHSVTTEADKAAWQVTQTLKALSALEMQTVFTYPNTDSGGSAIVNVLKSYSNKPFIRIVPNLGYRKYLSLMRIAAIMVGNSSSGILEAPSFQLPVVNVGTRQHGRLRANNVIDVGYNKEEIISAIHFALENQGYRLALKACRNPYGEGNTAQKTVDILTRLRIIPALLSKWINTSENFLEINPHGV